MTPAGGVPAQLNVGGCDQSAAPLKSTLVPVNTDSRSFRVILPSGTTLPDFVTVSVEANSLAKVTVPPENFAPPKVTVPPENFAPPKVTVPPENEESLS